MIVPDALIPVMLSPVVVNTATFGVPAMVTKALPSGVLNPKKLLPYAMAFLVMLPASVALPVILRSPSTVTSRGDTSKVRLPCTTVSTLPSIVGM